MNELALLPLLTGRVTFWIVRQSNLCCLPGAFRMAGEQRAGTVSVVFLLLVKMISCSVVCLWNLNIWS